MTTVLDVLLLRSTEKLSRTVPVPDMAREQTASAIARLLELSIADVLGEAWRRHRTLVAAAQATQANPSAIQAVDLATHRITYTSRPSVDVHVNEVHQTTVHCELNLVFDVHGLAGAVHNGRLVSVRRGRCQLTASLAVAGRTVATQHAALDLRAALDLGDGVPLLAEEPLLT